jgi:hypothetical protein
MRPVVHHVIGGVLAYAVTYALIGLPTVPRTPEYLHVDPPNEFVALEAYRAGGEPLWQAVGWFPVNAHNIPVDISTGTQEVSWVNFVFPGARWLGVIVGWLGLVPFVACFVIGFAIAVTSPRSTPIARSVGAYMTVGDVPALVASTIRFSGAVGPVDATFTLVMGYPADRWLLPAVAAPLLFGSLGAFLGRSPLLEPFRDRIVSDT